MSRINQASGRVNSTTKPGSRWAKKIERWEEKVGRPGSCEAEDNGKKVSG